MAYLQIVLLSLALCVGINAFSAIPAKYFKKYQNHPLVCDHRSELFREKIQHALVTIGSFEVSLPPNFTFVLGLLAPPPKPGPRQQAGGPKAEFASKHAKKYNDDPCDDYGCIKACNFIFEKDFGFCPTEQWCVCYD